jgi:endonuclease I
MVSPRLFLTNNHVLPAKQDAVHSVVEFDYQLDTLGRLLPVREFRLDPDAFYMTSQKLDFTLVAVQPMALDNTELRLFAWLRLIGAEGKILIGDPVNIIQHPNGRPKQIAFRNNRLLDLLDLYEHYETDTEPGSSGSPVFNDQWEVVALHHSGVPRMKDGQILAKDGSVWKDGMDPEQIDWVANEGIRISRLVSHVEKQKLSGEQARLRDEMLSLEPPTPLEMASAAAGVAIVKTAVMPDPVNRIEQPVHVNPADRADQAGTTHLVEYPVQTGVAGEYTINIPIHITVRVGAPSLAGGSPGAAAEIPAVATTVITQDGGGASKNGAGTDELPPVEMSAEVRAALAELAAAPDRVYYDEPADRQDREAYYQGVSPDDGGMALYDQLNELLTRTHTTRPAYKPSKHVYPWIDLHETPQGLRIRSIYSGDEFDAEEFILADFRIEQERQRLIEMRTSENMLAPLSEAAWQEALEASLPFNCEHVVPQSWFARAEPMRGDLHHLFALESGCNSFRGNTPYFDFGDFEEKVRERCGRLEPGKFEPNSGKGAIARAVMYFLLRYPGEIDATGAEYTADRIAVLMSWHTANPPDVYEKHRNQAIYQKQGNRNPLIDHPEWAQQIAFERGLKVRG